MNRSVTQPDTDDSEPEMLTLSSESRKRQSTSTSTSATSKRTKHGIGRAMAKVNEVLASLDTEEKSGSDSSSSNEEEENMVVSHNDLSYYSDEEEAVTSKDSMTRSNAHSTPVTQAKTSGKELNKKAKISPANKQAKTSAKNITVRKQVKTCAGKPQSLAGKQGKTAVTRTPVRQVKVICQSENARKHDEVTPPGRPRPRLHCSSRSVSPEHEDLEGFDDHISPDVTPRTIHSPPPESDAVKSALKEITSLLNTVVKRIDRVEDQLRQQNATSVSSSSSDRKPARKKSTIPLVVKSEVRKTYKMLFEDDDDFDGFDFDPSVTFNSPSNEAVVARLVKEVLANNPQFQACHVRNAAYTYYRTKAQEQSLTQRGKFYERNRVRRRRERLLRKLQERTSIVNKSTLSEKAKEKWGKVLVAEVISSEESDNENEDAVFVKPLPWRTAIVDNFFAQLDEKGIESKSTQAKRQRKKRVVSTSVSTRQPPPGLPKWAVITE